MPPSKEPAKTIAERSIQQAIDDGCYPLAAYEFIQQGLAHTVEKIHGALVDPDANRHVSGQELCEGLRDYALSQWGLMARMVLRRWNITSTLDFGRIVFALIDSEQLQRTDDDTIDDFRAVFDFRTGLGSEYRIP